VRRFNRENLVMRLALFATCLLLCATARAGSVSLAVIDKDGKPAADVVVTIEPRGPRAPLPVPAEPVVVVQQDLRFVPFLTVVPAGATVRFVNKDDYDHHVRSTPSGPLSAVAPVSSFELRQGPAGARRTASSPPTVAEVKLVVPGPIGIGCHLHGSMRGQLFVVGTPWFGKTDAQGRLTIDGVPPGDAELRLWHPDQLIDQPVQPLVVPVEALRLGATLNFTPRRRQR
jgi:plastocyanin